MLGILSMIIGGIGFAFSATDQKYAETKACMDAEKAGRRFYTDSHGRQRDVKTNRILTTYEVLRPSKLPAQIEAEEKPLDNTTEVEKETPFYVIKQFKPVYQKKYKTLGNSIEYFETQEDVYAYVNMFKKNKVISNMYNIFYSNEEK